MIKIKYESAYRIFDKDTDCKTKNDHFQEMLLEARNRGLESPLVCFDSWYSELEAFNHLFDRICHQYEIEHRLTKVNHPSANGQVERMNRTIKEATVKRYYYETHKNLKKHLNLFPAAYNFAKRLKPIKGLTPHEYIVKCWQNDNKRFKISPNHYTLGLNS